MKRSDLYRLLSSSVLMTCISAPLAVAQSPSCPPGFALGFVTDALPTSTLALAVAPPSFGAYPGEIFVVSDALEQVIRVTPKGSVHEFATGIFQATNLSFAPGGAFGTDLYVSANQDSTSFDYGAIWRVNTLGTPTYFGTQTPPGPLAYRFGAGGIAFSLGGAFGEWLYTGFSGGSLGDGISRVSSTGTTTQLFNLLSGSSGISPGAPFGIQFGPGVAGFGSDLYFAYYQSGGFPGGIYRLKSDGTRSTFSTVCTDPAEIEFGPGGSFGRDLYVVSRAGAIFRVDSTGTATTFVSGIAGGAFGLAFDDTLALYFNAVNPDGAGRLYKVVPLTVTAVNSLNPVPSIRMTAGPNPFTGRLRVEFSGIQGIPTSLNIYSVNGRLVRRLFGPGGGVGVHGVIWDGANDAGRPVPGGVYFVTLVSGAKRIVRRTVLIR